MATILVKKGAGTPSPDDLQEAELALDVVGGALYSKLSDGEIHQLNDGADVDAGVEIGPEPTNPSQGMLWLNDADQTVYIWDEGKWLEFPAGGTGGGEVGTVTTSSVMLEPDSRNTLPPNLATQKDVNRYISGVFDKLLDDSGNPIDVDLSDYYTQTESDAKYQPKGNYILDAPNDGNLHLRRNGAWEIYTPSSGGGFGDMEFAVQPTQAGAFTAEQDISMLGWYTGSATSGGAITFTVPAGMVFVLSDIKLAVGTYALSDIVMDGIKPWANIAVEMYGNQWLFNGRDVAPFPYIIKSSITVSYKNYHKAHIVGTFYKDDASLRTKLKEKVADEIKGQAGTLEVPDE